MDLCAENQKGKQSGEEGCGGHQEDGGHLERPGCAQACVSVYLPRNRLFRTS